MMQKSFSAIYYCGYCASYGHLPNLCLRRKTDTVVTEPLQLIPVSKTKWMHLRKTDECVKTALSALGEKPMICQMEGRLHRVDFKENTRRLKAACAKGSEEHRRVIRWYDSEGIVLNFEPWAYMNGEYLKNPRGDVITKKGQWVGRYDGVLDIYMPNPADIIPEEDCRV
jgi:hypothetical protein